MQRRWKFTQMIVYRFEKNGIGPYVSRTSIPYRPRKETRSQKVQQKKLQHIMSTRYTTDRFELWSKAHSSKEYMFGCSSKELLRVYFGGNFKPYFKAGFRIKRYKVPDSEVIDMQLEVAFPVKYHKLQTLENIKKKTS